MIAGIAIGGFIGTIVGMGIMCLMAVSKEPIMQPVADIPGSCTPGNCWKKCEVWNVCDDKWVRS